MGQADCCCSCCISVANDDDEDVDNRCSAVCLGPLLSKLRRPCPGGDSTEAAVLTLPDFPLSAPVHAHSAGTDASRD